MDLDAVRTFVTVADTGRFAEAARTARAATLTTDGRAFLPGRGAGTRTPNWARRPARTARQMAGS